jgi:MFS family permease
VALTPLVAGFLASALGWRATYAIFGIVGIAVGLASLTLRELPQRDQREESARVTSQEEEGKSFLPLVFLLAAGGTIGLCYRGVITFLPTYLAQKVQIDFLPLEFPSH